MASHQANGAAGPSVTRQRTPPPTNHQLAQHNHMEIGQDDHAAMSILAQMSQGQPAKRSPPVPASYSAYRPAPAPTATHPSPPSSTHTLPTSAHPLPNPHQRSPAPALPSVRTNPDLFRPDAFPARLPPTSASASEAYLARAPAPGAAGSLGAPGAASGYTRLPPIDLSGARSRQGSVVGRSAPPSRATSVEPATEGEDELSPHAGGGGALAHGQARKRASFGEANGSAAGGVSGTATPVGAEGQVGPNGEPVDWTRTRKDNHKEVERRRRETINDGINDLKQIVPGCDKNKGSILQRSVEYITELKENEAKMVEKWTLEQLLNNQTVTELRHELEAYKRHTATLERENHALRVDNQRLNHELGSGPPPAKDQPVSPEAAREAGWVKGGVAGTSVGEVEAAYKAKEEAEAEERVQGLGQAGVVPAKREAEEDGGGGEEKKAKVE